jgi:hypothetical protein
MFPYLVAAIIVIGLPTIYVAVRYREYRKFLAGAFFVSSGMQFYFYLAKVPIPLVWTDAVPVARAQRRAWHDPLCVLSCLSVFRVVLPRRAPCGLGRLWVARLCMRGQPVRYIDQSMPIVAETEQIVNRRNSRLKTRAKVFDGS